MYEISRLLMVLLLLFMAGCGQKETEVAIDYVALGDSLTAGQTPYSSIDQSYTDMIAERLDAQAQLASYTNELAVPGYTAADVLKDLASEEARNLVGSADLITISAGANDLLRLLRLNAADGTVTIADDEAEAAMDQVSDNMSAILNELDEQAPKADIYVMGYYFPFPHLPEEQKAELAEQLSKLNQSLQQAAETGDAAFVPVDKAFADDAADWLPNPQDVHPSIEGYKAMADAFWENYNRAEQ